MLVKSRELLGWACSRSHHHRGRRGIKTNYNNSEGTAQRKYLRREILAKNSTMNADKKFGLLFDIDGVLLRGKEPISVAPEAMKMIYQVVFIGKTF